MHFVYENGPGNVLCRVEAGHQVTPALDKSIRTEALGRSTEERRIVSVHLVGQTGASGCPILQVNGLQKDRDAIRNVDAIGHGDTPRERAKCASAAATAFSTYAG